MEKGQETENTEKNTHIMAENFPGMVQESNIQLSVANRTPNSHYQRKNFSRTHQSQNPGNLTPEQYLKSYRKGVNHLQK